MTNSTAILILISEQPSPNCEAKTTAPPRRHQTHQDGEVQNPTGLFLASELGVATSEKKSVVYVAHTITINSHYLRDRERASTPNLIQHLKTLQNIS